MCTLHKQMQTFPPRCSKTTPWRSRISRPLHKLIGHRLRYSRRRFRSYQARSRYSQQNSPQCKPRTCGWRNQDTNKPHQGMDIGRPAARTRWRQTTSISQPILSKRTELRPKWVLLLPWIQGGGVPHFSYMLVSKNKHNKSATRLNIMVGKTWNKEWTKGWPTGDQRSEEGRG